MHLQLQFQQNNNGTARQRENSSAVLGCFSGFKERIEIWQNGIHLTGSFKFGNKLLVNVPNLKKNKPVVIEYYSGNGNYTVGQIFDITCPESYQFDDGTQFTLVELPEKFSPSLLFANLFYF